MSRVVWTFAVVCLGTCVLTAAAGCRENASVPAPPEGKAARAGDPLRATGDRYVYELEFRPAAPEVGQLFEVVTTVRDRQTGEQVSLPQVEVDATMPHHGHGMSTIPRHAPLPDGRFLTRGMRLHMSGRWVIQVSASDGDRAELLFDQAN